MSDAEWPAPEPAAPRDPERRPAPLPRLEDLPVAEQGYDREKVREAFDAFYRHAAQLDATLSTLEAVEVFQRTSAELRAELRAIRGSGWTVGSWQGGGGGYGGRQRVSEWSLPPAFPRVAGEAIFLIVMGVIVGVAGWSRLTIVLVMALSLAVVWLIEWVAARERAIPQATAAPVVPDLDEVPAEAAAEAEAEAWAPAEEGPEAMTMLGAPPVRVDEEDAEAADHAEPQAEVEEVEAEALVEPEATVEPEVEEEPEVLEDLPAEEDPAEPVLEETAAEPPAPVAEAEPGVEEPEPEVEEVEEVEPEPEDEPQPDLLAEPLPEPEPVIVVLEDENAKRGRGFFSFFRRKEEFMPVVTIAAAEPGLEPVPLESEEQVAAAEEVEGEVLDGAQALEELDVPEPGEPEPALDPWEAPPVVPEEPLVEELEPEPVAELEPEVEPEPESEPEPEPLVAELEPEPDPDVLPEPEPVDQGPLPIDVLAEQAAAALERSRARRRHLRRARRR